MKKVYQKKLFSWGCMLICFRPLLFFIFLVLLHWKYVHHVKERILLRTNMYVLLGTVQKSGHIRYVRAHCNILVCFRTIHGILSWKEFTTQLYKRKLNLQNFQQFSITFNHKNTTNFCTANFPLLNQRRTNGNLLKCNFLIEGKITNII